MQTSVKPFVSGRINELPTCPVLVLVGGMGTRLRSAYADGPKALAPVGGKPFLAYLLKLLADAGLSRVVLCVGYRADQIERWLGNGKDLGLSVSYSREEEPMGTAGALKLAYSRYAKGERILAINGDSILQLSLPAMWELHVSRRSDATIALAHVPDVSRYGSVEVSENDEVILFREKCGENYSENFGAQRQPASGFINGGVYLFEPSVMESVPDGRPISLEREVLPAQLSCGLLAYKSNGYFIDIGVPQDLLRAQVELGAVVAL